MNFRLPALAGALILATTVAASAYTPTQFKLGEQNKSGETATATILDGLNGNLIVRVRTNGGPAEAQPIHIHRGTCATLDPKPLYPLKPVVDGMSETEVPNVTLAQFTKGNYAINVHKSVKEVATYVTCGDLKAGKMAASL